MPHSPIGVFLLALQTCIAHQDAPHVVRVLSEQEPHALALVVSQVLIQGCRNLRTASKGVGFSIFEECV